MFQNFKQFYGSVMANEVVLTNKKDWPPLVLLYWLLNHKDIKVNFLSMKLQDFKLKL